MLMSLAYHYVPAEPAPKKSLRALKLHVIDNSLLSITFFLIRMLLFFKLSYSNANFENFLKKQGTISNRALSETFTTTLLLVCYTAVFSVVTQCSSPQTAAENRTTFLSLCVCGLTNKQIMYKKFDNT